MRRIAGRYYAAGLAAVGVFSLAAETRPPDLTLQAAVEEALQHNPGLRALQAEAAAMGQRGAQSAALPNPMVTFGAMDTTDNLRPPDSMEKRVTVEQALPGFGKRGLRVKMAEAEAAGGALEAGMGRRELVMQVKETGYELAALQKTLALVRVEQEVMNRMEETARTRYTIGAADSQDLLKAQSESIMLRQRLIDLEQREKGLKARLNQLLNRPADQPMGKLIAPAPSGPAPDPEWLIRQAKEANPEIGAARNRLIRAELDQRLAVREGWPDFTLGVESRTIDQEPDTLMLMVGLDLPVWRSRTRAARREADHRRDAGQAALESAERQLEFEIRNACFKIETARRSLALTREALLPQAESRFVSAEAAYRSGKIPFADLLESQRFALEARVMEAMTEGELGMQTARLERAAGADLKASAASAAGTR